MNKKLTRSKRSSRSFRICFAKRLGKCERLRNSRSQAVRLSCRTNYKFSNCSLLEKRERTKCVCCKNGIRMTPCSQLLRKRAPRNYNLIVVAIHSYNSFVIYNSLKIQFIQFIRTLQAASIAALQQSSSKHDRQPPKKSTIAKQIQANENVNALQPLSVVLPCWRRIWLIRHVVK